MTMHAVAEARTADAASSEWTARAAGAVLRRWSPTLTPDYPQELLEERSAGLVATFLEALAHQGLSRSDVARGERVNVEWLAAEISAMGDWRGLPNDPYDYEDARDVARTLVGFVRAGY